MFFNLLTNPATTDGNCPEAGPWHSYRSNDKLYLKNSVGCQWTAGQWVASNAPPMEEGKYYIIVIKYKYEDPATNLTLKFYNNNSWTTASDSTLWALEEDADGQWVKTDNGTSNCSWSTSIEKTSVTEKRFLFLSGVADPDVRLSLGYGQCFIQEKWTCNQVTGTTGLSSNGDMKYDCEDDMDGGGQRGFKCTSNTGRSIDLGMRFDCSTNSGCDYGNYCEETIDKIFEVDDADLCSWSGFEGQIKDINNKYWGPSLQYTWNTTENGSVLPNPCQSGYKCWSRDDIEMAAAAMADGHYNKEYNVRFDVSFCMTGLLNCGYNYDDYSGFDGRWKVTGGKYGPNVGEVTYGGNWATLNDTAVGRKMKVYYSNWSNAWAADCVAWQDNSPYNHLSATRPRTYTVMDNTEYRTACNAGDYRQTVGTTESTVPIEYCGTSSMITAFALGRTVWDDGAACYDDDYDDNTVSSGFAHHKAWPGITYKANGGCSSGAGCDEDTANYSEPHATAQTAEISELIIQEVNPDVANSRSNYGIEIQNENNNIQVDSTYNNFAVAQRGMTMWINGPNTMFSSNVDGGAYGYVRWLTSTDGTSFVRLGAPLPPHNGQPVQAILAIKLRQDMLYNNATHADGTVDADGGEDDMMLIGPGDLVYDNNNFLIGFYSWKHSWGWDVAHRWYMGWKILTPVDYIFEHGLYDFNVEPYGLQTKDETGKVVFDSRLEPMRITPTDYFGHSNCNWNGQEGAVMLYENVESSGYWDDADPEGSYASQPFYILEGPNYENIYRKSCRNAYTQYSHNTGSWDCLRGRCISTAEGAYLAGPYSGIEFFQCAFNNETQIGNRVGSSTPYYNFSNDAWTAGPGVGNDPDPGCLNNWYTPTPYVEIAGYSSYDVSNQTQNELFVNGDADPTAYYHQFIPEHRYVVDAGPKDEEAAELTPLIYEILVGQSDGNGLNLHYYNQCGTTESQAYIKFASVGGHYGSPVDDTMDDAGFDPPGLDDAGHKGTFDGVHMNWGITSHGHTRLIGYSSCTGTFMSTCDYQIDCWHENYSQHYSSPDLMAGRSFKWNAWFKKPGDYGIYLVNIHSEVGPWEVRKIRKSGNSCKWYGYGELGV